MSDQKNRPRLGDSYSDEHAVTAAQCGMSPVTWWLYSVAAAVLGCPGPGERVTRELLAQEMRKTEMLKQALSSLTATAEDGES